MFRTVDSCGDIYVQIDVDHPIAEQRERTVAGIWKLRINVVTKILRRLKFTVRL